MKKRIKLFASLFAVTLFSLAACDDNKNSANSNSQTNNTNTVQPTKKTYTVTFDSKGGSKVNSVTVEENASVSKPSDPTKDGYIFDGWYLDEALTNKMDFSTKINSNTNLYAKWRIVETLPVDTYYTVIFDTNGGSSITSVEVLENTKVSKPTNPTKEGYKFVGWFTDVGLTSEMNFDNPITKETTLYAKWEKVIDNNTTYGIVDRDFKIPTSVTFSNEMHTSANHTVINCGSLSSSGSYSQNFDKESNAYSVDNVSVIKYRYNISGGRLNLLPDNSYYNGTLYHGREGSIFNILPLGGINKVEVTYTATYSSENNKGYQFNDNEKINPNIRFGNDPSCSDYVYFLNPSNTLGICNVNLSKYKYFSVNTGSYTLSLSTITVDYDNNSTSSATYSARSGEDKVRINPIRYTYPLVAGESKITVPLKYEYNKATNTYTVTESKELTYYTSNYVSSHPECKSEATIVDPILVSSYYIAFGKWPANYSENPSRIRSIFGDDTRTVSKYNRTDGYVRAVPWDYSGWYYELDIDLDGSYQNSRGSGRVVAWESGWSASGYDNAPVCIYTDDHYNTFLEYLNNGTWSSRFNAEGIVAGIKYSTAPTVALTGFDPHMVEGTGSGDEGGGNIDEQKVINDNDYYANFAPVEIINEQTALYQQVTNICGINNDSVYIIANNASSTVYPYTYGCNFNSSNHSIQFNDPDQLRYLKKFYFEKQSNNTGYIYYYENGEKCYFGTPSSSGNSDPDKSKTLFTFGFDAYGNLNLTAYNKFLRFNTANGGFFRFYSGGQNPIQLYRYCDIEGATPIQYEFSDQEFELVRSKADITDTDGYIIVSEKAKKAYYSEGKYIVDSDTKELRMTEGSYPFSFTLEKHPDYDLYAISPGWMYFSYVAEANCLDYTDDPMYFDIEFNDGMAKFIPMSLDTGTPEPLCINNEVIYFGYNSIIEEFCGMTDASKLDIRLYKVVVTIPDPVKHIEYSMIYSTEKFGLDHDLILVSADGKNCLTDDSDAIYNIGGYDLTIEGTPSYKVIHIVKHETENVYSISYEDDGTTKYIGVNIDTYEMFESNEPCYFVVYIFGDSSVRIEPAIIHPTLNEYVGISYDKEYCSFKYNLDEEKFMLCRYDAPTKEYLFEVTENWY